MNDRVQPWKFWSAPRYIFPSPNLFWGDVKKRTTIKNEKTLIVHSNLEVWQISKNEYFHVFLVTLLLYISTCSYYLALTRNNLWFFVFVGNWRTGLSLFNYFLLLFPAVLAYFCKMGLKVNSTNLSCKREKVWFE